VAELEGLRSEYRALRAEVRTGEARVEELRRRYATRQEAAREAERLGTEIDGLRETAALLPSLEAAARVLEEGRASLDQIRRDHARRVEEIERETARLTREIESLERESADLERTVPDPEPIRKEVERTAAAVKEIEGRLSVLREELAAARAARGMLEERLASLKELRSRSSRLHRRAAAFSLLAKAFSKDGIVALEIEDIGPALTAEANALLRECMDGRFAINVRLLVNTADGNGTRETFEILVHDSRSPDGEPKLLNDLSGGEAAVVEPAVVHALALLDAARAGGRLEAAFCDEILSRLSPWNRLEAFEAFRRFHRRGRFRVSFLVTHEEEVWSRCDHVLRFEEGGIRGLP
jgi:exonuclease SbcC